LLQIGEQANLNDDSEGRPYSFNEIIEHNQSSNYLLRRERCQGRALTLKLSNNRVFDENFVAIKVKKMKKKLNKLP